MTLLAATKSDACYRITHIVPHGSEGAKMFWDFRKNFVRDLLGRELKLGEGGARKKSHAFAIVVPSQRGLKTIGDKNGAGDFATKMANRINKPFFKNI